MELFGSVMNFFDILIIIVGIPLIIFSCYLIIRIMLDEFEENGFTKGILFILFIFACIISYFFIENITYKIAEFIGDNLYKCCLIVLIPVIVLVISNKKSKKYSFSLD